MATKAEAKQADLTEVAALVVEGLRKVPEVAQADQMSFFTNRAADDRKIYIRTTDGKVIRFHISALIKRATKSGE